MDHGLRRVGDCVDGRPVAHHAHHLAHHLSGSEAVPGRSESMDGSLRQRGDPSQ
jgi:hypothetical protein